MPENKAEKQGWVARAEGKPLSGNPYNKFSLQIQINAIRLTGLMTGSWKMKFVAERLSGKSSFNFLKI